MAVGITHHTAPVALRERVALPPERVLPALQVLRDAPDVREVSVLSTCNRTELLMALAREESPAPLEWFARRAAELEVPLEQHLVVHRGPLAARHLFRVAAGLDSLMVGEPQILGQVKESFRLAHAAGTAGRFLARLYQQAFAVAKRVRTETALGAGPVSVAYAAASLARQIFGDLSGRTALIVGAGETAELVLRHLQGAGIGQVIVANRTLTRAQALAARCGAHAVALGALPDVLSRADVVVSSTHAELPILGKGAVERALRARRHRPMFLVDLAVPRDVEPEVGALADVYLYTVDDLRAVADAGRRAREAEVAAAERLVDAQVEGFVAWCNAQDAVPLVRALRASMQGTRDEVLERALAELARGVPAQDVLRRFAHLLTNKLAHTPSVRLRAAGQEGDAQVLAAARRLFGIE
jgi:glutamyl-tRNA reductase